MVDQVNSRTGEQWTAGGQLVRRASTNSLISQLFTFLLFTCSISRLRPRNGDEGARTLNPRLAKAVLSQLSYVPETVADRHCDQSATELTA